MNEQDNNNQFLFLHHKRNLSITKQEIPLLLHDIDKEDAKENSNNNKEEEQIINLEECENDESDNSKSNSNLKSIIKDKIQQIKEYKDHQRKCLLPESEDNLYGKTKGPKDMLNDIYQLISENVNKSDSESENEKMISQWENEQYKSGLNTNKIKVDHCSGENEQKENMNEVFDKIRNKINLDVNSILSSIQSDLMKDERDLEYFRKKKASYQDEITSIKNNESIIDDKISFYINQYFKSKNVFFELLQNEDNISNQNDEDDIYYLSN